MSSKWIRSKIFTEVVYNKDIPNRLLVEENGKVNLYGGKVYEKSMRMEKGTRILKQWSRLDNAKKSLEQIYRQESQRWS